MTGQEPSRNQAEKAGRRIRKALERGENVSLDDIAVVDAFRAWHLPTVIALQTRLTDELHSRELGPEDLPITARPKTLEAIVAKLVRTKTALPRMQDIAGARIVVPWLPVQVYLRYALERLFGPGVERVTDTVDDGDQWGYRAIHVIVRIDGRLGEVQIRTTAQDRWAQVVEATDKAMRIDLKHGRGPADWVQWLQELSDEFRKADLAQPYQVPPSPIDQLLPPPE